MPRSSITLEEWCYNNNCLNLLDNLIDKDNKYISYASHKKIGWRCQFNHEFYIDPCKFTNPARCGGNVGVFKCPVCSGQKVVVGFNDLITTRPDLAAEWNYERNDILPTQVTKGSHKDVWWKCSRNHEWIARISARDYRNGCPYCSNVPKTSIPEQILFYYCKKYFPDTLNMYSLEGVSYDICIPSRKILIEYDGSVWHENKNTSYKFKHAFDNDFILYKISGVVNSTEPNTFIFDDNNINFTSRYNKFVDILFNFLSSVFGISEIFVDYDKAYVFAKNQKIRSKSEVVSLPDGLEFEWSPLNGYDFSYISNDGLDKYWRCFNGHTFKRRLDVIKRGNITCPFCHNKKSFQYKCFGSIDDLYVILDVYTCDIEFLSDNEVLKALSLGYNIQGIILHDSILSYSLDYIYFMKGTTFRLNFDCIISKQFNCLDNKYIDFVDGLSNIFSVGSAEYIHDKLNKYIS